MSTRGMMTVALAGVCAFVLLAAGCGACSAAVTTDSTDAAQAPTLFPAPIGDSFGFIDRTGTMVIEPQFDGAGPFSEGLAAVEFAADCMLSFIDTAGTVVIQQPMMGAFPTRFSEGLAGVSFGDRGMGFIDKTGTVVIEPRFDFVSPFSEGLAAVMVHDEEGPKGGFIDKTGEFVLEPQFSWVWPFSEGLAAVLVDDMGVGFVDRTGEFV